MWNIEETQTEKCVVQFVMRRDLPLNITLKGDFVIMLLFNFSEKYHDISMNLRTLKRRLREYGLRNRTEVYSVHEVREIVKREIEGSPSLLGYPSGRIIEIGAYLQPNLVSIAMNVPFPCRKLHRLCEYTLINFKCQSLRSNVTTVQTKHCKV